MKDRCYLVYALASDGMDAREANEGELARLDDPGPLEGWTLSMHPLTFSLTAVGLVAQAELTMEEYAGRSLAELRAAEPDDKRYWWQKRR